MLNRTPTKTDQLTLNNALLTIEAEYPASPSGVLIGSVSYGLPYFNRLPQSLVSAHVPHLASAPTRFVLEEATPMPTDVVGGLVGGPNALIPGVTKDRFNVNVVIESNDVLFQFRSDSMTNLTDVVLWLNGSNKLNGQNVTSPNFNGLFAFQPTRTQFVQQGMPRKVADANNLEFAPRINPDSSMAMRRAGQRRHISPSNQSQSATFTGEGRVGHIAALQRVSRVADGTPLHIRNDGPGFDGMDVPAFRTFPGSGGVTMSAGTSQFKLQFLM